MRKKLEDEFYLQVQRSGYKSAQRLLDRHLLHQPSKITFFERIAFLLGAESVFLTRLHADMSDEIEFKMNNINNDMP